MQRPSRWFWKGMMDLEREQPGSYRQWVESYVACVQFMDHQLGRLMKALDASPRGKETMIILWSDHGFHLGEQNLWGKLTNYDMSTRVPLLFIAPSRNTKGRVVQQAVELLDLYPTLADLCSLKKPAILEGKSLLPHFANNQVETTHFAISQFPRPVSYDFRRSDPKNMGYSIRTDRYRYTQWIEFESSAILTEEFYDYTQDNFEKANMINVPHYAKIIKELSRKLEDLIRN